MSVMTVVRDYLYAVCSFAHICVAVWTPGHVCQGTLIYVSQIKSLQRSVRGCQFAFACLPTSCRPVTSLRSTCRDKLISGSRDGARLTNGVTKVVV